MKVPEARHRRLRRDRSGAATIEFAMWMTFVFLVLLPTLDLAIFVIERGRLSQAIGGATVAAFKNRANVDYTALPGYVRAASGSRNAAAMTVTVSCNGTSTCSNQNRVCACLSQTGTFVSATGCGQPCGAGSTPSSLSGYYLQVHATQPFDPILMPSGAMGTKRIVQAATVRLQ